MDKIAHTPTPWRYESETMTIRSVPANYWLATMDSWDSSVSNTTNAAFIVRACNSHADLLAACEAIDTFFVFFDSHIPPNTGGGAREALRMVKNAIARAKE